MWLRATRRPLYGMLVVDTARYFGLMVMAEGDAAWAPPVKKVDERLQWIKALGGSLVTHIRRFNMYCFSVLRYWSYLLPVHSAIVA